MESQITGVSIVYSTVCSGPDYRRHQSSASPAFVRRTHRSLVNSPHNNAENVTIWWRHRERKASGICFPKVVYLSKAAILDQPSLKRKCHFEEINFSCCTGSRESMCSWQRWFESGMHGNLESSGKSCVAKQFTWCLGIALSDRSCLLSTFNPISVESQFIFNRTQCVVWKWFKGYKSRFCKTRYIHCGEIVSLMNSPPPQPPTPPHPHTPTPPPHNLLSKQSNNRRFEITWRSCDVINWN